MLGLLFDNGDMSPGTGNGEGGSALEISVLEAFCEGPNGRCGFKAIVNESGVPQPAQCK